VKTVFSGIRPTGNMHLGNYLGALKNYLILQNQAEHKCIYCVADVHALTTMQDPASLHKNSLNLVKDWLAAGLDPQKSILFIQSQVPQVMELYTYFSMSTPLSWLLRVPTFKEKVKANPENANFGLVGYPILQTADVALYKTDIVPVGEDQLPHLELAREIVRRFNQSYGEVFPEPQAKLTQVPLVIGLDGKAKMSKSLDNHVEISLSEADTRQRVLTAVTDTLRIKKSDPGHPDLCNVFSWHKFFNERNLTQISFDCQNAAMGCVSCKQILAEAINDELRPYRQRRAELSDDLVIKVIKEGACQASELAKQTIREVKQAMGLV